jgi:hypothetical protein
MYSPMRCQKVMNRGGPLTDMMCKLRYARHSLDWRCYKSTFVSEVKNEINFE